MSWLNEFLRLRYPLDGGLSNELSLCGRGLSNELSLRCRGLSNVLLLRDGGGDLSNELFLRCGGGDLSNELSLRGGGDLSNELRRRRPIELGRSMDGGNVGLYCCDCCC